jgi:arsenate reductase
MHAPQVRGQRLADWERDGLRAVLSRVNLPIDDIGDPERLFWRFTRLDDVVVGFGGLESQGRHALLRSVVTLPPVRGKGFGRSIVQALELEARVLRAREIWLLTTNQQDFFAHLGYAATPRDTAPQTIQATREFAELCAANATLMVKRRD